MLVDTSSEPIDGLDTLTLLTRFFEVVLVCTADGRVVRSFGVAPNLESIHESSQFAAIALFLTDRSATSEVVQFGVRLKAVALDEGLTAIGLDRPTDHLEPGFAYLSENVSQGMWRLGPHGEVLEANAQIARWLECSASELIGTQAADFIVNREKSGSSRLDAEFVTRTGKHRRAVLASIPLANGEALQIVTDTTVDHDIRQNLVRQVQEMAVLARTDPLTGLANRIQYEEVVQLLTDAGEPLAVVLLDMDDLKEINDSGGHLAGDEALCALADALRLTVRDSDVVARLGGDEFAIILGGASARVAREVVARIEMVLAEQGVEASIGWAHSDDGRSDLDRRADAAMYAQKRARKGA